MPSAPFAQVKSDVINLLKEMVAKNKSKGAMILKDPHEGEFGVKINDNLYAYIRDYSQGNLGSRTGNGDPNFWLILSGGPKPMPTRYQPAFPGAEGFGSMTTGGRGGKVIYVTNLNSSGDLAPKEDEAMKESWRVMPVTNDKATDLEKNLLPTIGASFPKRDTTDAHWIEGIVTRKGKPAFWASSEALSSYNSGRIPKSH